MSTPTPELLSAPRARNDAHDARSRTLHRAYGARNSADIKISCSKWARHSRPQSRNRPATSAAHLWAPFLASYPQRLAARLPLSTLKVSRTASS